MQKFLYPIIYVIIFTIMQVLATVAFLIAELIKNPNLLEPFYASGGKESELLRAIDPNAFSWSIIISGIMTVAIIALLQKKEKTNAMNLHVADWRTGLMAMAGAVLCIFSMNIASEFANLPDNMEELHIDFATSPIGLLSMALIGPIIEEYVFRESILGHMLRKNVSAWTAIIISALIFGIIHANPAQIPAATGIGVVLGIIYYKTGNITIPCIIHIANNSIAAWGLYEMGPESKNYSLVEAIGGHNIACIYMIISLVCGIGLLYYFWKHYPQTRP